MKKPIVVNHILRKWIKKKKISLLFKLSKLLDYRNSYLIDTNQLKV